MLFNINSEGSGEFYFKNKLSEIFDRLGAVYEPIEILNFDDVPFTSFNFERLTT